MVLNETLGKPLATGAPTAPPRCDGALVMHLGVPGAQCNRCGKAYGLLGAPMPATCDAAAAPSDVLRRVSRAGCSACGYSGPNDVHFCVELKLTEPARLAWQASRDLALLEVAIMKPLVDFAGVIRERTPPFAAVDMAKAVTGAAAEIVRLVDERQGTYAHLGRELCAILAEQAHGRGEGEGPAEILRRIIRERDEHVLPMGDGRVEYTAIPSTELARLREIEAAAKDLDARGHVRAAARGATSRCQEGLRLCAAVNCGLAPKALSEDPTAKAAPPIWTRVVVDGSFVGVDWAVGQRPKAQPFTLADLSDRLYRAHRSAAASIAEFGRPDGEREEAVERAWAAVLDVPPEPKRCIAVTTKRCPWCGSARISEGTGPLGGETLCDECHMMWRVTVRQSVVSSAEWEAATAAPAPVALPAGASLVRDMKAGLDAAAGALGRMMPPARSWFTLDVQPALDCPPSRTEDVQREGTAGARLMKPEAGGGLASRSDLTPGLRPRWKR